MTPGSRNDLPMRVRWRFFVGTLLGLAAASAALVGCGSDDERPRLTRPPSPQRVWDDESDAGDTSIACPEGAKRDCKVFLGEHGGVVNCFVGEQVCRDGVWEACVEPEV